MAWTTEGAFDIFYGEINLPGEHHGIANTRRDWVLQRLKNTGIDVIEAVPFGSIPRYTALKEHADVDVLAVLHHAKHIKDRKPSEVLLNVKNALGTGQAGKGRRNGQAVTVTFQTWPSIDVVPASRIANDGVVTGYKIPDMNREVWLPTNPPQHSREMSAAVTARGSRFRRVITMLKHWNRRQPVKLQSYHLEVIALKLATSWTDYSWPIYQWFQSAQTLTHFCWHADQDITDYLTWQQAETINEQLRAAEQTANTAWYKHYSGQPDQAIPLWKSVFGQKFPAYG
ncbi:nucleotidyltransferase [Mycobacterium hackensackense]|uniref:nucleotidyltransferase domain-containing protein n=1 Tax=Mycobacterium hackensackense TaxID=228909 RepID=UPI002265D85F|nr:nucleotidyltransferase [Mycobacterium hackensackense]MCV7250847.1 nucleotidyltransferase [Mycobacterium hackensackense]